MRWLFLLLIVLNVFYYVWHQQEAPLRAKDVTPLSLYRGSQQDIRLLSETAGDRRRGEGAPRQECLFLGGFTDEDSIARLRQRLLSMRVAVQSAPKDAAGSGYWLAVAPEGQRLLGDQQLQNLSKEFNELKRKIMLCEGVAPAE